MEQSNVAIVESIFEVKVAIMGPKRDQKKELGMRNRKIRWTERGLTWEADLRHVLVITKVLHLEQATGCETPADDKVGNGSSDDDVEMSVDEIKQFRSLSSEGVLS